MNDASLPPSTVTVARPLRGGRASSVLRVASNYARLGCSLIVGLLVVRLLLGFGNDAFGMIMLITAVSASLVWAREALIASLLPELGAAYHSNAAGRLRDAYTAATLVSVGLGVGATVLLLGLVAAIGWLSIPPSLQAAAVLLLATKAAQHGLAFVLAPLVSMLLVAERMVAHNVQVLLQRMGELAAAAAGLAVAPIHGLPSALATYAVLSAAIPTLVQGVAAWWVWRQDRRLRLRVRGLDRTTLRRMSGFLGWNSLVTLSNNLYLRFDVLAMNVAFGLLGNLVFGVAMQLAAYVRQLTNGLVLGLDAAASRLTSQNDARSSRELMAASTRWQSALIFPACAGLLLFTEPLVGAWLSGRLEDPATTLPIICGLVRWIVVGIAARSLAEGWQKMLSGAGEVRRFAPLLWKTSLLNPPLVTLAMLALPVYRMYVPAACYALLGTVAYLLLLPQCVARHFGISRGELFRPMLRPLYATLTACGAAGLWMLCTTGAWQTLGGGVVLISVYAVGVAVVVLTSDERHAALRLLRRPTAPAAVGVAQPSQPLKKSA